MSPESDTARVPELMLERYRLGELPRAEVQRLEQRLLKDEELRQRLEALERSDQEIHRRYPPDWLAERVRARRASRTVVPRVKPTWSRYWPLPAALAAATLLLVLTPQAFAPPPGGPGPAPLPTAESGVRIKGLRPTLMVFRKTAEGNEALADGAVARAGDLLRLGYRAAGRPYGVIVSIDGRGSVTLHLPAQGRQAARLQSGDAILLDHSYELDDAPRWERFYFVTSETPFDVAPVVEAARRAAVAASGAPPEALLLPASAGQTAFSLEKKAGQ